MRRIFIQCKGFSLLELLTVIVILSILAVGGVQLYSQQVIRVHRYAAKLALFQLSSKLELFYQDHHTYEKATLPVLKLPSKTETGRYEIKLTTLGKNNFFVQAVPVDAQAVDVECGILGLDHAGRKTITGQGTVMACWL